MVVLQLAIVALSLAVPQRPQAAPSVQDQRRQFRHAELLTALGHRLEATEDAVAKQTLATDLARVRLEAQLLQRLAPLGQFVGQPPADLLGRLAALDKSAAEELVLAEFAFLLRRPELAELALGRARDRDPSRPVRQQSDRLLAAARQQRIPRGGYHRYRGAWLALADRDDCRALDQALAAVEGLSAGTSPIGGLRLPFVPSASRCNRPQFRKLGKGQGEIALRAAALQIRQALEVDYKVVRRWLASYSKLSSRRQAVIAKRDAMRADQAKAIALIRRYSKLEQGQVDANRAKLAADYKSFRADFDRELAALRRSSPTKAFAIHDRLRRREDALVAIDRFFGTAKLERLPPGVIPSAADSSLTTSHLLPGRRMSGLEDSLWLLVKFRAGQIIDTVVRGDEILRQRKRLTKWEALLLDEILSDAIEAYNDRVATSLDGVELEFVAVTNRYRRSLGLRPLELEERLNVAAKKHSQEMVDLGYFGHVSPVARNRTPSARARLEGYAGGVGENCLAGRVSARGAFEGWYHSPGHHRLLISGGPHLGIGAAARHAMWTMVAGGTDWTWRSLHRDLPPAERQRLHALVQSLLGVLVSAANRPASKIRAAAVTATVAQVRKELPAILPALARAAFPIARDSSLAHHPAFPASLALLIDAEVGVPWRALQVAAVAAAIEAMRFGRTAGLRAIAHELVRPHLGVELPYDAKASGDRLTEMVNAIYRRWEDIDQWRFRVDPAATPAPAQVAGRRGDGPSLDAPRLMLTRRERLRMAKKFGGDVRTEQAVELGLRFLAKVQDTDGAWRAKSFGLRLPKFEGNPGRGSAEWEIAMTGMSLLAFTSAGYTTEQGDYQAVVRRGTEFLMNRILDYGKFETVASHYMYNHALGAQALCEVYSYCADPTIGAAAQLAVDYLVHAQHQGSGGWRYNANQAGDTSVTGWAIMALNSAYKSQVEVSGFRPAMRFLDQVTRRPYYEVGYLHPADHGIRGLRLTAVAMTGRLFLGAKSTDSRLVLPAFRMMERLPSARAPDFYYWYYATLALFQIGEPFWNQWNAALKPAVLSLQNTKPGPLRGSFTARGRWSGYGGRIYQTALGVLMLTTYYRYGRGTKTRTHPFTGDIDKHAAPFLAALRTERDAVRRNLALRRMIDLFGPSLVAPIARILLAGKLAGKAEARFRQTLAGILIDVAERRHAPILVGLLADEDPKVVVEVIEAFARVGSSAEAKVLGDSLNSKHRAVRAHCASWLGRLGDPASVALLSQRLAVERDPWAKSELTKALARLSRRSELTKLLDRVLPAATAGYLAIVEGLAPIERGGLIEALGSLDVDDLRPVLIRYQGAAAIPVLFLLLRSDALDTRTRALKRLRAITRKSFGFDPKATPRARATALALWQQWWKKAAVGFGTAAK